MHTNVILTNKRCTHAQPNYTNTKPKTGLGASYAIWPGNGVGLFYTPGPKQGLHINSIVIETERILP